MIENLEGQKFGYLTVISYDKEQKKWKCQCDCGNIHYVKAQNLKTGNTKSCGCKQNALGTKRPRQTKSLLNKNVGQLKVVDIDEENNMATCFCMECQANTIDIPLDKLKEMYRTRRISYTCGIDNCVHIRKSCTNQSSVNILPNTRFGRLIVEQKLPNKLVKTKKSFSSIPMYQCKCDCGNRIEVQGRYLINGNTKSCGCLKEDNFKNKFPYIDITSSKEGKILYKIYKRWENKFKNPSKQFKEKVIDKGIKFFPELENKEKGFKLFYQWAIVNGFDSENEKYLVRIDYNKDFTMQNCIWSRKNIRGY